MKTLHDILKLCEQTHFATDSGARMHKRLQQIAIGEDKMLGACVRKVMQCDVILMDDGWGDSHGCKVERFTAQEYGKEIWTLFDLEGLKSK